MSRFNQAGNEPSYSELKPERFNRGSDYVAPEAAAEQGLVRAIDDAPGLDELQGIGGARARRGFEGLKR